MVSSKDSLVLDAYQSGRTGSNGWVRNNCPFCPYVLGKDDDDAAFGVQEGTGFYMCFKCETRGKLRKPPDWFPIDELPDEVEEDEDEDPDWEPPAGYTELWTREALKTMTLRPARRYLYRRALDEHDVWADAALGVCTGGYFGGRIIIPVRDGEGRWWGYAGRDYTGRQDPPYLYPKGFHREQHMYEQHLLYEETDRPVLVVEGPLDVLAYWGCAVGCLGKPAESHIELLAEAKRPIAVCLDGDAWEEGEAVAMRLRLRGKVAGFVKIPAKEDPHSLYEKYGRGWLLRKARHATEEAKQGA